MGREGRRRRSGPIEQATRAATDGGGDRVLVLNPVAGTGDHVAEVRSRAAEHGFEVRETESEGDAVEFARDAAAAGASIVAAAGGDGTLNEVVRGIREAGKLGDVTFAVVPAGTGNNFASNVGISGIADAFRAIERSEVREIDVGLANDDLFVNSCVAGLTADASAATDSEMKARLGVLAYVAATIRHLPDYDGLPLRVQTDEVVDEAVEPADAEPGADATERDTDWEGRALMVLIGNARRFPGQGWPAPGDAEDGLLDVTVVAGQPSGDLLGEGALGRLLAGEETAMHRLRAPAISIESLDDEPIEFSLDGEMVSTPSLDVSIERRRLPLFVGEAYEPSPTS
ncbi:diacylglycerol/lipid kinase family protein [Natronoarchaeum rubrum]|uniref:diacylglycerol/lipid kinase family protein n=1 Tax=Natronoarchaeum rubrum TaxID=755311 RepID=UPI00211135B5|nr:diacylglycerol kinase family protein [Natronoarchaeum rubrum]